MFASNFDGLLPLIFGVPIAIVLLGLISLIPAAFGHGSALVLAIPCALLGVLLFFALFEGDPKDADLVMWVLFTAPFLVSSASIALWNNRRRRRS